MWTQFIVRPEALASLPLIVTLECGPPVPPIEPDPSAAIDSLAGGGEHLCALSKPARLRCWGSHATGQLGAVIDEDLGDDELPYEGYLPGHDVEHGIPGSADIVQVSAHDGHTCLLTTRGTVRCWGHKSYIGVKAKEHIGDDEAPSEVPYVAVGGRVSQIATGPLRTCARLTDGRVRCWGLNFGGELGYGLIGTVGDDEHPAEVGDVPLGVAAKQIVGGGDHFCVITETDAVRCWGLNYDGQLGLGHEESVGDDEPPSAAGDVPLGGDKIVQLAVGYVHTCALNAQGEVRCWGLGEHGQLGYANTDDVGDDEPAEAVGYVMIDGTRAVEQIAAGAAHTCAVLEDGAVKCWGLGSYGQTGSGSVENIGDDEHPASVDDVDLGEPVKSLTLGMQTCALLSAGRVRCWGRNEHGQLGLGTTEPVGDDEVPASLADIAVF